MMARTALIDRFVDECRAVPHVTPGQVELAEAVLDYVHAAGKHDPVARAMRDAAFWIISQTERSVGERWAALDKLADHYGEPNLDVRRIVGWWLQ